MIMNTLNQKDIKTLINEGNFREVANRYKKVVEVEPNNYKAHNNLGNDERHVIAFDIIPEYGVVEYSE